MVKKTVITNTKISSNCYIKNNQRGGLFITVPDREVAFNTFLNNSKLYTIIRGAYGITFRSVLNADIISPYANIATSNLYDYGDRVRSLLIKLVFIKDNDDIAREQQKEDTDVILNGSQNNIINIGKVSIDDFKNEVNTQTEIFLKTVDYLQPLCPGIVYANIYENKHNLVDLLEILSRLGGDDATNLLLNDIKNTKDIVNGNIQYTKIGLIAMEFAENFVMLRDCKRDPDFFLYETMGLYLLIRLAVDLGYTHADFHIGNIMIDKRANSYFQDYGGKPLLIDFGQAYKIPYDKLQLIKQHYNNKEYTGILNILCSLNRLDGVVIHEHQNSYGWVCGTWDTIFRQKKRGFDPNTNSNITKLIYSRDAAIYNMILLFNEKHAANPEKYPIIPLDKKNKRNIYKGLN